jgi:hypothetical protein
MYINFKKVVAVAFITVVMFGTSYYAFKTGGDVALDEIKLLCETDNAFQLDGKIYVCGPIKEQGVAS